MSDPSPPGEKSRPGDANQPGRQEMEALNADRRQPRREWILEEIEKLDESMDRLIERANLLPEANYEFVMSAVRIWSAKRWLEDQLLPRRRRRSRR
jgi:hypothetical protein